MKTSVVKYIVSFTAGMLFALGAKADRTWTGESTESTKYWSDAENWSGSDGTRFVNTNTAPTIYFSELSSIANILRIDCGTADSPVVFTTGNTDDRTKGLSMDEGSGNAIIGMGSNAVLKVDGGAYTFANDLVAGSATGKTGTLIINKGKVASRYWTVLCGYAEGSVGNIIVNDGELAVGTGNGRLVIGQFNGSTAVFTQTGGTVTSEQGEAALEMACGTANATYNLSGGSYTATGNAWIGCGTGTEGAKVNVSDGTLTITGNALVGKGSGSKGDITISGGRMVVNGEFWLGSGANATATVNMTGGILEAKSWLSLSRGSASVSGISSTFNLSGGAVTNTVQHVSIGSFQAPDSTATFNVSGGELYAANDIYVGENHNGTLNISGTGKVITPANVMLGRFYNNGALNLNGGSLSALAITRGTSTGTTTLTFNGGTFNRTGSTTEIIASAIPVTIGANGGTIDIGDSDATIAAAISGTGTLTKSGSGALTLSGTYVGGLSVAEGAGSVTTPGNDTVSAGTTVFLASGATGSAATTDISGKTIVIESNGHISLTNVVLSISAVVTEQRLFDVASFKLLGSTVSAGTDVSSYFTVSGATAAPTIVYKDGAIYAVADLTENKWTATEAGAWSDENNWSKQSVPTEYSQVVFESDAVVTCSGTATTKNWLKLVIRNGATVEFRNTDDTTFPAWEIDTGSIEGTGTIVLTHCGLNATSDVAIPSTISLVIQNTTSTTADGYDCWLTADDDCTLTIAGGVTVKNFMVTNGSVVFDGSVAFDSGARLCIATGTTTFNGAVTCAGTASLEKASAASVAKGEGSTFTQPTVGSSHVDAAIASLYSVDTSVNYWVGGESGNWNVDKNWNYGVPAESGTARFDSAATIYLDGNKTVASVVVNASVMFSSTDLNTVHPRIYIHDVDGTGTIRLNHVGFEGNGGDYRIGSASDNALTLEFVSTTTDSWLTNVNAYAPITGAGYIVLYEGAKLYGDNSAFTGTLKKGDVDARFMTPQSGFPNASSVTIDGTIWLWFTEGEIAFGGNFAAWTASGNHGINLPEGVSGVTLTLGGGNGTVNMSRGYVHPKWHSFYKPYVQNGNGWIGGTDKFAIRKIGTGDMGILGVDELYNLSLEGGVSTIDVNLWSHLSLTVKDGATLNLTGARTVATADFKSGSTLCSTYYDGGVNLLTVTGAATLDGVTLTATGTTPSTDTTYTVLSAGSLSGTATSGIADPDTTDKKVWKALVGSSALTLKYYKQPIMIIVK
ncbi:MAG: hypothetical protein K6F50_01765 [Kiritimatiellae bacterium]|nr:hypothetical protein [Kiritimatiellia bacterium]